jgi:hypothetical protein
VANAIKCTKVTKVASIGTAQMTLSMSLRGVLVIGCLSVDDDKLALVTLLSDEIKRTTAEHRHD